MGDSPVPIRRAVTRALGILALALVLMLQLAVVALAAAAPAQPLADVKIAFSKNAYWYQPGASVRLLVTLDNRTDAPVTGVDVRLRIHPRNASRSDLDAAFDGTLDRSSKQTETLGRNLSLKPGNNSFTFDTKLSSGNYSDGVYPTTVEAVREGSSLASGVSEIIVFSMQDNKKLTPLKLSIVFDTLEPPHRGPDGVFKGDELAAESDPSNRQPGWYTRLLQTTDKAQGFNASFSLSPVLLDEMNEMTGGYEVKVGDKVQHRGADSAGASAASSTLSAFRRLAQTPRFQVLPAPYASPNLEALVALRWVSDARQQITAGHKALEKDLDTALGGQYSCPPGLQMSSRALRDLGRDAGQFLLISSDALERTKAGKKMLRGDTLAQPVTVSGAKKQPNTQALFQDARLSHLFEMVTPSGDAHGVAQVILAELTNLYLEQPDELRACAVEWPARWRPTRDVLEQVIKAITDSPWIKTATLAESMTAVPGLENDPLDIPEAAAPSDEYFNEVAVARQKYKAFSSMVMRDNTMLPTLSENLAISESDVWRQWDRRVEGLTYAGAVIQAVDAEVNKVDIPAVRSISMTSGSAKIPLSIINGTSYRISATLKLSSNGLTFPKGSTQKVKLEPKENLLEIPVKVKKKGRVRFQARLEASNFILGEVDFTVLTSRFNTFAAAIVGGLLALIGAIWISKAMGRRKVGKHKRRNLAENGKGEEGEGAKA